MQQTNFDSNFVNKLIQAGFDPLASAVITREASFFGFAQFDADKQVQEYMRKGRNAFYQQIENLPKDNNDPIFIAKTLRKSFVEGALGESIISLKDASKYLINVLNNYIK